MKLFLCEKPSQGRESVKMKKTLFGLEQQMRRLKRTFDKVVVICCWAFLLLVLLGFTQFIQAVHSQYDVRVAALLKWADNDELRLNRVETFFDQCVIGRSSDNLGELSTQLSTQECSSALGYDDLYEVLSEADQTLKHFAWPLSLVAEHRVFKALGNEKAEVSNE